MTHSTAAHMVLTRPTVTLPALLLALSACLPAWAANARYELDPVHTRVQFAVSHAGFSQALGTVSGSTGTIEFDPDDWTGAHVDVTVPLQRLDLGDSDWNRATLARNLLDAQRWPQAHFVSTRVEPLAPDRFIVHGQLTLRDVTREVPLEVTFNALKRHPLPPFRRTAGFSATTRLSRRDFGIEAWPSVIGDSVELRIEIEATRARAGSDGQDDDAGARTAPATVPDDADADADVDTGADAGPDADATDPEADPATGSGNQEPTPQ